MDTKATFLFITTQNSLSIIYLVAIHKALLSLTRRPQVAYSTCYKVVCFNQSGDICTLNGGSLKLVDKFTYLGSCVSSSENDSNTRLAKAWKVLDRLSVIWKSDLSDKIKRNFFPAAVVSILQYGCTTWTLTKHIEKRLDGNWTRMLRAIIKIS